ncbi:MAG: hypothetical protein HZC40_04715 [Chloroflexi bacterium]|nr:hypothetical protein [Chloroflexota bacterium]
MSEMTLKIIGQKSMTGRLGKEEVVVIPFRKYQALLQKLEDLEDVLDAQRAMAEYRAGKARPFNDYLKEHRSKRRVSSSKR